MRLQCPGATRPPAGSARGPSGRLRAPSYAQVEGFLERQPVVPHGPEGELQRAGQRRMLDDHDRELGSAADRVLHAEHHDGLVDDHELERDLLDEPRLLTGLDEATDTLGRLGVVEDGELVDAARDVAARDLDALDVLLRRRRIWGLREDEDLAFDPGLELGEALVDRAAV